MLDQTLNYIFILLIQDSDDIDRLEMMVHKQIADGQLSLELWVQVRSFCRQVEIFS